MVEIPDPPFDETQEAADIRRLAQAAKGTEDSFFSDGAIVRAVKLAKATGIDLTDTTVSTLLGLDKIPPKLLGDED